MESKLRDEYKLRKIVNTTFKQHKSQRNKPQSKKAKELFHRSKFKIMEWTQSCDIAAFYSSPSNTSLCSLRVETLGLLALVTLVFLQHHWTKILFRFYIEFSVQHVYISDVDRGYYYRYYYLFFSVYDLRSPAQDHNRQKSDVNAFHLAVKTAYLCLILKHIWKKIVVLGDGFYY